MQWDLYPVFDVAPGPPRNGPCTDHARGGPSGCPRGRLGTLAGIAHRIYKAENLVAPKGDVIPLPEDETLAAFVRVFDEGDPLVREKLLAAMRAEGIQGQRRGHCRRADGCGIHLDHRKAAQDVVGATRRTPP
jgi:hypothetical protein